MADEQFEMNSSFTKLTLTETRQKRKEKKKQQQKQQEETKVIAFRVKVQPRRACTLQRVSGPREECGRQTRDTVIHISGQTGQGRKWMWRDGSPVRVLTSPASCDHCCDTRRHKATRGDTVAVGVGRVLQWLHRQGLGRAGRVA